MLSCDLANPCLARQGSLVLRTGVTPLLMKSAFSMAPFNADSPGADDAAATVLVKPAHDLSRRALPRPEARAAARRYPAPGRGWSLVADDIVEQRRNLSAS